MATIAVSELRRRLALALVNAGWHESVWPYPIFPGPPGDARSAAHRSIAVGTPRTDLYRADKQVLAFGAVVTTIFGVRHTWRLRQDAAIADYDDALDAEGKLIRTALAADATDGQFVLAGIPTRETTGDGTMFLGEVQFSVLHTYQLE